MRIDLSTNIADINLLYLNGDTAYVRIKTFALGNLFSGTVDLEYSRTHKNSQNLDQLVIGHLGMRWQIDAVDNKVASIHPAEYIHNPLSLDVVKWEAENPAIANSDERLSKAQATYDRVLQLLKSRRFVSVHIDGLDKYAERCKNKAYPSGTSSSIPGEYAGRPDPAKPLFDLLNSVKD